MLPI
jgi:hypothetical protein